MSYTRKGEDTDVPRAKIVPCFPSGTLKSDEQQSTVAERPLLPLSCRPELLEVGVGSVSPVPSRIAHPLWIRPIPPGGGCRRYDCEDVTPQLTRPMPASWPEPCGLNCCFQCSVIGGSVPYTGRLRAPCTATGPRFTRNLITVPRKPAQGQVFPGGIRVSLAVFERFSPHVSLWA